MTFLDIFFIGIGLAIDASCVCTSNGLVYKPSILSSIKLALVYAVFQGIMPLIGYFGIGLFSLKLFEYNHIVALVLLSVLGVKMIYESLGDSQGCVDIGESNKGATLTTSMLLMQGVATSIDALSVGITFNNYNVEFVLYAVVLIAVITMVMCFISVRIGIHIGTMLNNKASLVGGLVLIFLGIKIFLVG